MVSGVIPPSADKLVKTPIELLQHLTKRKSFDFEENAYGRNRKYFVVELTMSQGKYTGESYNKKEAKMMCVVKAIKGEFGISFPGFEAETATTADS